jgi:hypothetical protein
MSKLLFYIRVIPAKALYRPEQVRHACDKSDCIGFERTKCGPKGERQDA